MFIKDIQITEPKNLEYIFLFPGWTLCLAIESPKNQYNGINLSVLRLNPVPGNNVLPAEIADFYIKVSFFLSYRHYHSSNHQNYEEQHDEDHEERQKDANSLEHQDTIVIQADEVAEAPSLSVPTPDDDESAFVEMGIQFVDALRKNDFFLSFIFS